MRPKCSPALKITAMRFSCTPKSNNEKHEQELATGIAKTKAGRIMLNGRTSVFTRMSLQVWWVPLSSTPPARVSRKRHHKEGVITWRRDDLNSVLEGSRERQLLALGIKAA